ncbi:MAG: hypothetical protein AAFN91_02365 [Pseudomonadota bacterium]
MKYATDREQYGQGQDHIGLTRDQLEEGQNDEKYWCILGHVRMSSYSAL